MAAATGRIMVRRGLWMRCTAHVMATGPVYGTRTAVRWGGPAQPSAFGGRRPVPHAPPMAFSGLPYVIQLSVWMVDAPAGQLS